MHQEKLLSVPEAAEFLGVAPVTIWRKLGTKDSEQEIDCYKIGGRVLLSMENHILPYLKRCEKKAQDKTADIFHSSELPIPFEGGGANE